MIKTKRRLKNYSIQVLRLAFSLAKANFKLRNEGSYLGFLWYLLSPLAFFSIILFVRTEAFGVIDIPYYPIYLLVGLLIHHFAMNTIAASVTAISSSGNLVKSVKLPYESIVLAKVLQFVFAHIFEIILLLLFLAYFGVGFSGIFVYILVIGIFSIFLFGVSLMFSILGVHLNDLGNIWTAFSQMLFFVTPIFYLPTADSLLYKVNLWNPFYYFVTAAREMLVFGRLPSAHILLTVICLSVSALVMGLFIFEKNKDDLAELV